MKKSYFLILSMLIFLAFPIVVQGQQTFQFPLQGTDTFSVASYPAWWQNGDYVEGQRSVSGQVVSGTFNLVFSSNGLSNDCSPGNWVDLNFSVNGQVVATHRVNIGDTSATVPFTLPSPVSGTLTARIEETNTVCSNGGSIQIADTGASTLELSESVQAIPTMTQWGMIIFILLAGLGSVYYLRRQKRANN